MQLGERVSRFWLSVVCRNRRVEQLFNLLLHRDLRNTEPWNRLAAAVPQPKRVPKAGFKGFEKFSGCFSLLFTSYSQGGFPSLAVRRQSSKG